MIDTRKSVAIKGSARWQNKNMKHWKSLKRCTCIAMNVLHTLPFVRRFPGKISRVRGQSVMLVWCDWKELTLLGVSCTDTSVAVSTVADSHDAPDLNLSLEALTLTEGSFCARSGRNDYYCEVNGLVPDHSLPTYIFRSEFIREWRRELTWQTFWVEDSNTKSTCKLNTWHFDRWSHSWLPLSVSHLQYDNGVIDHFWTDIVATTVTPIDGTYKGMCRNFSNFPKKLNKNTGLELPLEVWMECWYCLQKHSLTNVCLSVALMCMGCRWGGSK